MRWFVLVSVTLVVVSQAGCQNMCGGGYPMQGMTRVPPPGTGSYPMPGSYYNPMGSQSATTPAGNLPTTSLAADPIATPAVVSAGYSASNSLATTASANVNPAGYSADGSSSVSTNPINQVSPAQYPQQPTSPNLQWQR